MKWFKHDADAHTDAKLEKVLMRYGADGYALYWMCLELIAKKVDQNNLTFELEHDAEILGYRLKVDQIRIQEIMTYMITLGLFERHEMAIYCYKLAKRVDVSMFPPNHRERVRAELNTLLNGENQVESVISHDESVSSQERLDYIRSDKRKEDIKDLLVEDKSSTSKTYNYSDEHLNFAKNMFLRIQDVMPKTKKPNFEKWASEIRVAVKALDISLADFWKVFMWANADSFWKTNILSPAKLREKYPQLEIKLNERYQPSSQAIRSQSKKPPLTEGQRIRIQLNAERAARGEPPIDF